MPGHWLADNSATWDYVTNHIPKELYQKLEDHPDKEEIHRKMVIFQHRKAGNGAGNTNLKCLTKQWLGLRDGINHHLAYRYDIVLVDGRREEREAYVLPNLRLAVERGMNPDVLQMATERPLLAGVENQPGLFVISESSRRFKTSFEKRMSDHEVGMIRAKDFLREDWRIEYREQKTAPDGKIISKADPSSWQWIDIKTAKGIGDWKIEVESFRMLQSFRAVLICVRNPRSDEPWLGAFSAKYFDPLLFEVYSEEEQRRIEALNPGGAAIMCNKNTSHASGRSMIIVPRAAVIPLDEFTKENFELVQRERMTV